MDKSKNVIIIQCTVYRITLSDIKKVTSIILVSIIGKNEDSSLEIRKKLI